MKHAQRRAGFTLVEVLVALALVAATLGGTLIVLRQAIGAQARLEERLAAHWVAENVINQFLLEQQELSEYEQAGNETMLGRRYRYRLAVVELPLRAATNAEQADSSPPVRYEIMVEVSAAGVPEAELARSVRHVERPPSI
jgi:general secretion pathway protein I